MSKLLSSLALLGALLGAQPLAAQHPDLEHADPAKRKAARAVMEGRLISETRQLTLEGRRAGEGYYRLDGTKMVFQSERHQGNPWYQIYVMDFETGDVDLVSPGHGKTTCAFLHPTEDAVLYASTHADPESVKLQEDELAFRASGQSRRYAWDYDDWFDIWVKNLESGKEVNLTKVKGYDAEGSYSPDGEWIVFSSNRHAFTEELSKEDAERFAVDRSLFLDIYVMRKDGSEVRRLTDARGYDGGPFYSYDGKKICWRRFNELGTQAEIMTMNADGSDVRQLTTLKAMSWAPFFHPSGEYLIFTTNRHGFANFELYLVDAKGRGEPVRVTWTAGFDGLPTFTPDGRQIAWTTNRTPDGTSQIYIGNWNHAQAMEILAATFGNSGPALPETTSKVREEDLEAWVTTLCAPEFEGRGLGTAGEQAATALAARAFEKLGLAPLSQESGYFHTFTVTDPETGRALEGRSVLASLTAFKGANGDADPATRPLIIGAHLDHLGRSEGRLHPGADGNASGAAALLEIAEQFAAWQKAGKLEPTRPVLFALWSGGEWNAAGSRKWIAQAKDGRLFGAPLEIGAYLNLDTIGRLDERLLVGGVATSSDWKGLIERANAPVGLRLELQDGTETGPDARSFAMAEVPALSLFTGAHLTDGTPDDLPETLDYRGLQRVTRFAGLLARAAVREAVALPFTAPNSEEEAERPKTTGRPWFGTIPDYAEAPIPGLRLSGVAPGGPAAEGGLKGGDIIVGLNGQAIANIHDYAAILEEVKVGQEVPVRYVRDGVEKTTTVTPRARQ